MRLEDGAILRAQALLFDMDGTIVDSTAVVHRLWRRWAVEHGQDLDTVLRIQHGRRSVETMRAFAHIGIDVDAETERFAEAERADLDSIVEVPGARALLEALPPERWAVVTSAERPLALARLRAAGLPVPRVLVTAEDVTHGKPDPECYRLGAAWLDVAIEACLVFEDAPAGLAAGHAAGAQVVALATSLTEAELEAELGAEQVLADYRSVSVEFGDAIVLRFGMRKAD